MLSRIIAWSITNRFLVTVFALGLAVAGVIALGRTPLDAVPDLSDVQVIVQTDYEGQAPQIVEDQVTYPVSSQLLKVPGARTVRGYSFFGVSFVYVIFEDGTDLYWARSRVLEVVSGLSGQLPRTATPVLGPDATGLGWIYQYVLEDTMGMRSLADLRSIQDWYLRYRLTSVPGVSEVASVGGFEKTYEVSVDPLRLRGYGIPVARVVDAIRASNQDAGAMMMELTEREFMVRGVGYLQGITDIESITVASTATGTPVRLADIAEVRLSPEVRRGVADLDGRGDAVGGIVIMRSGENALATLERVKARLSELQPGLPPGVVVRPVYDRSDIIHRAIGTLKEKLIEEAIIVALVSVVFLFHARSALVAVLTLPLGILMAFAAMRVLGIGADIMSLGGIAIAIGAMIDAAIVMVENMHKHVERALAGRADARLSGAERWDIVLRSSKEVGPALFFSLLIITVSFLPVFTLEAQEGRLFKPLAWTKTLAMAAASLLSITVVPVAMGFFVRGRMRAEHANPLSRILIRAYRPVIAFVMRWRWPVIAAALASVLLSLVPLSRLGSEFMPPLDEGTLLFMPTTLPGVSIARARQILQLQDSILATFPEVKSVFGKAGRAGTATDPAGLDMFETTIVLEPESAWRRGLTMDALIAEMDAAVRFPGVTNSWTMPIRGRIDMLATGIRTPVGIKIFGPDLAELERIGRQIEEAVRTVPGTRSVFAERAVSGFYLDVDIDRVAAARYGINVQDIQEVLASAVGGMTLTQTVQGRERYGVRLRYPQELRDEPEKLAEVLIPVAQDLGAARRPSGGSMGDMGDGAERSSVRAGTAQVPLGLVATIRRVSGPMALRTENAFPTAWVFVDITGRDPGSYVRAAQQIVRDHITLPPGYSLEWSGQFEYMQRATQRLALVVPATLFLIFLLLWLNFRNVTETLIIMLSLPFALAGGFTFLWLLGYHLSVATAIGFIALAGVAAETGVIMLIYLDHAWTERVAAGRSTRADLHDAVMAGAVDRVRPKLMTVTAITAGLLPILAGHGTGASVMQRIAAPMVGGMVSSTVLTLIVIPAIWSLWKERSLVRQPASEAVPAPADALPLPG